MNFRALNKNLIVRVAREPEESKTASGLILDTKALRKDQKWREGEVVSVGSTVESDISVGDVVRFDRWSGDSFNESEDYEYIRVAEAHLFAVKENA